MAKTTTPPASSVEPTNNASPAARPGFFGRIRNSIAGVFAAIGRMISRLLETFAFVFWFIGLLLSGLSGVCKVLIVTGFHFMLAPTVFDPYFLNSYRDAIPDEFQEQFLVTLASVGLLLCLCGPHRLHLVALGFIPSVLIHYQGSSHAWTMVAAVLVIAALAYLYGERLVGSLFALIGAFIGAWLCSLLNKYELVLVGEVTLPVKEINALVQDVVALHDTADAMLAVVVSHAGARLMVKLLIVTYQHWLVVLAVAVGYRVLKRFNMAFTLSSVTGVKATATATELPSFLPEDIRAFIDNDLVGPMTLSYKTLIESVVVFFSIAFASHLSGNHTFSFIISSIFGSWICSFAVAQLFQLVHLHLTLFSAMLVILWLPRLLQKLVARRKVKQVRSTGTDIPAAAGAAPRSVGIVTKTSSRCE